MYKNKRILAIVPARGGSKGVPLKNLRPLLGVPLVARVGEVLKRLPEIDRRVVSTDHEEIAKVAETAGISAEFRRPKHLSGDRVGDLEVLSHALLETERIDQQRYDIVVMLQPTSPMRRAEHVNQSIHKLVDEGHDAVWTVSEVDSKYHPLKQLTISDGRLELYDERGKKIIARQQLSRLYYRNGAAYAITRSCLLAQKTIMGEKTGAVVTEAMVSIDTLADFELVEFYLKQSQPEPARLK